MKPELDNQSVHRYMRVYNYYKQLILSQQLAPGSRLPSIRRCAAELQMSRTTVETAYMVLAADRILCDGHRQDAKNGRISEKCRSKRKEAGALQFCVCKC